MAMSRAPRQTRRVPPSDQRVNGSPRMRVAQMELKTRPEAWRVERTGRGSVVIWMVEPRRFETMNMAMPSCQRRRRWGGRRATWGAFSSSRMCDLRCRVRPRLWTLVEMRPTSMPIWSGERGSACCLLFWGDEGLVYAPAKTYSYTAFWRQIAELAQHHSAAGVRIHLRGDVLGSWWTCGLQTRPGDVGGGVVGMVGMVRFLRNVVVRSGPRRCHSDGSF